MNIKISTPSTPVSIGPASSRGSRIPRSGNYSTLSVGTRQEGNSGSRPVSGSRPSGVTSMGSESTTFDTLPTPTAGSTSLGGTYNVGPGEYVTCGPDGTPTHYITVTDSTYTSRLASGESGMGFPTVYNIEEEPQHYFEARAQLEQGTSFPKSYEQAEKRRLQQVWMDSKRAAAEAGARDASPEELAELNRQMNEAYEAWTNYREDNAYTNTYDFGSYTMTPVEGGPNQFEYSVTPRDTDTSRDTGSGPSPSYSISSKLESSKYPPLVISGEPVPRGTTKVSTSKRRKPRNSVLAKYMGGLS